LPVDAAQDDTHWHVRDDQRRPPMTETPEADITEELCEGLPGPAEPLPEHEPDEPTILDYDEEVEGDG
jgi:hypothetical protein